MGVAVEIGDGLNYYAAGQTVQGGSGAFILGESVKGLYECGLHGERTIRGT